MTKLKASLAIFLTLFISACVLGGEEISRIFVLKPATVETASLERPGELVLALPTASPGLDTERIILFNGEHALDYYANAKWATPLPELVQATLISAFENSKALPVTSDLSSVAGSTLLLSEIRHFEARYGTGKEPPSILITLVSKMVSTKTRKLVHTFESTAEVQSTEDKLASVIEAFDAAFSQVQQDVVTQSLAYLRNQPQIDAKKKARR